ncbi:MAG: Gx transporter family protein [Firmicutes bacterium]|nr:Gx transporter family protein [Bacillota bacterium]
MSKTKKIVIIALLVAQALVLHYIERMIPVNFGIPGAKLGLANIITLVALYLFSFKDVLTIIILRTLMSTLMSGSVSGLLFSMVGGILSFLVMYGVKELGKDYVSTMGVSIIGAISHNIGQIIVAAFIIESLKIAYYLPFLIIAAIGTGLFVGLTVNYLLGFLSKVDLIKHHPMTSN